MSAKVKLLDEQDILEWAYEAKIDDPKIHALGVRLIEVNRWAAKAHAWITSLNHCDDCATHDHGRCTCGRTKLLADIASPGGTDGH